MKVEDAISNVKVRGEVITDLPSDLYIPPDALRVFLEAFEGPLDLLLYLIKKQDFDILDIPLAEITQQYMQYIEVMRELQLDLAAEYLLMAAILAEIKSKWPLENRNMAQNNNGPIFKMNIVTIKKMIIMSISSYRFNHKTSALRDHIPLSFNTKAYLLMGSTTVANSLTLRLIRCIKIYIF